MDRFDRSEWTVMDHDSLVELYKKEFGFCSNLPAGFIVALRDPSSRLLWAATVCLCTWVKSWPSESSTGAETQTLGSLRVYADFLDAIVTEKHICSLSRDTSVQSPPTWDVLQAWRLAHYSRHQCRAQSSESWDHDYKVLVRSPAGDSQRTSRLFRSDEGSLWECASSRKLMFWNPKSNTISFNLTWKHFTKTKQNTCNKSAILQSPPF